MADGIKLEGGKELDRALNKLPGNVAKNAIAAALRAGGSVVVKSARENLDRAQWDYSALKSSIRTRVLRAKSKNTRLASIYPSAKRGGWLANIVEYGTLGSRSKPLASSTRRKVKHDPMPRGLLPVPFMRNALPGKEMAATSAMAKKLRIYIEKKFKELAR